MNRVCCFLHLSALLVGVMCGHSVACGDIILTVQDATISPAGNSFVNVFVRSNGTDRLTFASYDFSISALGGPISTLEFTVPQDLSEDGTSGYVFEGQNDGILLSTLTNSQLVADDAQDGSGDGYVTLSGTDLLLARLDLRHFLDPVQTPADALGERFQVTLNVASMDTIFSDDMDEDLSFDLVNSKFSGTVTVGAAAVPEPSSLLLLSVAGGIYVFNKRRRRSDDFVK